MNQYIDNQNSYDPDTEEAGVLLGDYTVQTMQYSIRSAIGSSVQGLETQYNQLYAIGIRTGYDGKLAIKDSSRLETALRENLDDVINLFADSGASSTNLIEFISSDSETKVGETYAVDITQAATRGIFRGTGIDDPAVTPLTLNSSNNRLRFTVNGIESNEIILTEKVYNSVDELISEIQDRIDNDSKIGSRGLTVEWVELGAGSGYLLLTSSTYGSNSKVGIISSISSSALAILGLAAGVNQDGLDVEGTINGEAAEGKGQYLTGKEDNETTEGLKLKITFTTEQLTEGEEGTITLSRGVASHLNHVLDSLTSTGDGMLDRRIKAVEGQVENLKERVEAFDERLELRRERLYAKYLWMEEILGQLNAQSEYLTIQINNLNANWRFNQSS